ncbi:hypothetical protein [Vibrio vulnificus]|uniref:hypothetical protein n=1 Tax=Vibrio vulnificus TaxID=672 RepID=UPI001034F5A0|nr:hypothetical protein [Vibrio vulnificus]EGR0354140.1 hypothetical protein [Vibrio vulnificus]EID4444556.1 hypothetical protein [Vibrio vulnificus]
MKYLKISSINGVIASKKLSHWKPFCHKWSCFIEVYSESTHFTDTAFNQNERANIGTFASAIWACGGIALEEFQDIKGDDKTSQNGRVDLWLKSLCGKSEYVEAKYLKRSLDGRYIKHINEALELAQKDALHTQGGSELDTVALLFFVPYLKRRPEHDISEEINVMLNHISNEIDTDILAWSFPAKDIWYRHHDGYAVPGVILIGRKF